MPKREKTEPERVCTRCEKMIRGRYEEIVTRRRTKLVLCAACVKKGL